MKEFFKAVKTMWKDNKAMTICGLLPIVVGPLAIVYGIAAVLLIGF